MNAEYTTSLLYPGNPYVEALPPMLAGQELIRALASVPPYSTSDRDRSTGERLQLLYGWTITSPGINLLDFIEQQGWQDLQMVEGVSLLDVLGTLPKGSGSRTKKPSSTRKYICPKCGNSCRATKTINIICGDCMEKMVVSE